ncbi:hypothetical protein [Streptomyces sp. NPDC056296]|uniref:hypothetical protein n=1 Tax=Streptomyces sp. NPDC056296 TaxID=3345775 RepID=UPI0035E28AD4
MPEEPLQGEPGVAIGQGAGRREVLRQTAADLCGGQGEPHGCSFVPVIVRVNRIADI